MKRIADGAWEERGVTGTRIEIDGDRLTLLWRGGPVLETKFKPKNTGDAIELALKRGGLRYPGDSRDYARIASLTLKDGKLILVEDFPITGKSESLLERTENTRYGACAVDNTLLPSLSGEWRAGDGTAFTLDGDRMEAFGHTLKVCLLRYNSGELVLADCDPTSSGLYGFSRLTLRGDALCGRMLMLDTPAPELTFRRA